MQFAPNWNPLACFLNLPNPGSRIAIPFYRPRKKYWTSELRSQRLPPEAETHVQPQDSRVQAGTEYQLRFLQLCPSHSPWPALSCALSIVTKPQDTSSCCFLVSDSQGGTAQVQCRCFSGVFPAQSTMTWWPRSSSVSFLEPVMSITHWLRGCSPVSFIL